jgi:hypothetical protein
VHSFLKHFIASSFVVKMQGCLRGCALQMQLPGAGCAACKGLQWQDMKCVGGQCKPILCG